MRPKSLRRVVLATAAICAAVVIPIGPAAANVSLSTSLTVPAATSVGQTGVAGSFTVINANTPPQAGASNTITELSLTLSCGAAGSAANPCPSPDPGVFQVTSATGAAGTACAGVTFSVSAPNANGTVTLTPTTPVSLLPPGGPAGSDRCTVNFTFSVLKLPVIDSNPGAAGVQTRTSLRAQATSSGLTVATFSSVEVTVARAVAGMTTQASPAVPAGGSVFDTATLTGVPGIAAPTGTVTFQLFGPNNATCTGSPVASSTNPVVGGTAQSDSFPVTQPGLYRFVASYSGDANYQPRSSGCNDPGESVTVRPRRPVADFDGDGKTDLAVFRPATGTWFLRALGGDRFVAFGTNGDIPVPADYDGDGKTDVATYRPSTGTWFISRSSGGDQARPFGVSTDLPVPGDYDGDGLADIAVYRPSNGGWFIRRATGMETFTAFGTSTDIPVQGDYDGDGKTDIAVFRPSTGGWFVQRSSGGSTFAAWGTTGDVPVPGDYDGDAKTDLAVYRPSNGIWFVQHSSGGTSAEAWGTTGDVPVPGDYDGDGKTDLAVFRPSSGLWLIRTSSGPAISGAWGANGDIPVALPPAIRLSVPASS